MVVSIIIIGHLCKKIDQLIMIEHFSNDVMIITKNNNQNAIIVRISMNFIFSDKLKNVHSFSPRGILLKNDSQENQYWTQQTSETCCPTDCCNNSTYTTSNGVNC
jgi:hypothetical protein